MHLRGVDADEMSSDGLDVSVAQKGTGAAAETVNDLNSKQA
jgi:hypothetical protein